LVQGVSAVFFREELFDFPVILLGTDGEFEIFAGDGIPVLTQYQRVIKEQKKKEHEPCKPSLQPKGCK
jgi:hypothetical protein